MDLQKLQPLKEELKTASGQKRIKAIRRLDVSMPSTALAIKSEWMILNIPPVIPDLRPLQLDGGRLPHLTQTLPPRYQPEQSFGLLA